MGLSERQDGADAVERIRSEFADAVIDAGSFRNQHWVELKLDRLVEVCRWLHDEPSMGFDHLVDVTAVHWPDRSPSMQMVYHLYSYARNDRLRIKSPTGDAGPVPTISEVWKSAEWNERETYDMFGIRFEGHPDHRRILMPDEYTDFPLRKEFPLYTG